ncbi:DUF4291 family protein [Streptomyces lasalocidi]
MAQPQREIRAAYADSTITVYQAYAPEIGLPAVQEGRFPAAWKRDRKTWVTKPRSQPLSGADERHEPADRPPGAASRLGAVRRLSVGLVRRSTRGRSCGAVCTSTVATSLLASWLSILKVYGRPSKASGNR